MLHDLRGQSGQGDTARRGTLGLGDLNGEKSNNCIRPEGGRPFREGCDLLLLFLLSFSLFFHSLILGWGGNLRKGGPGLERHEGYGLSLLLKYVLVISWVLAAVTMREHWAVLYSFPELNPHRLLVIVHTCTHIWTHTHTHTQSCTNSNNKLLAIMEPSLSKSKATPNCSPSIPIVPKVIMVGYCGEFRSAGTQRVCVC